LIVLLLCWRRRSSISAHPHQCKIRRYGHVNSHGYPRVEEGSLRFRGRGVVARWQMDVFHCQSRWSQSHLAAAFSRWPAGTNHWRSHGGRRHGHGARRPPTCASTRRFNSDAALPQLAFASAVSFFSRIPHRSALTLP
jgi:hypothetical protein